MRIFSGFYEDLSLALNYYRELAPSVGRSFIQEVNRALMQIERFPASGHAVRELRMLRLNRFPYGIYYYLAVDGEPVALFLYHHKRDVRKDWPK